MPDPPLIDPRLRLVFRVSEWLTHGDWLSIEGLREDVVVATWAAPYELRKLAMIWTRQGTGAPPQDAALCTFHFLNLTDGDPDDTWTNADYVSVENYATQYWEDIKGLYSQHVVLDELRWYRDGPAYRPFGEAHTVVERVTARNVLGTGADAMLPPQVAISVTEVTAARFTVTDVEGSPGEHVRNRWGRHYLPAPSTSALAGVASTPDARLGRLRADSQADIADAAATFFNSARDDELIPVMYSPTTGSSWSIDELHVDDIFDVIRRRRYVTPLSREPRMIPP